jgi:hypothetical protein
LDEGLYEGLGDGDSDSAECGQTALNEGC